MVVLRDLCMTDSQTIVIALNDHNVINHLSSKIPYPYSDEDAQWWIQQGSTQQAINKAITYQGKFCGVIGVYLQSFENQYSAELGYWLTPAYWHNGIATEAVITFTQWLFATTELRRIYNPVNTSNHASIRVKEKSGFILEGILKQSAYKNGQFSDENLYALLKS